MTVFAHALRFFKSHVLEELSDQSATQILEEDIGWVLTVPAIWRAPAKQFMRTAAYEVYCCCIVKWCTLVSSTGVLSAQAGIYPTTLCPR